MSRPIVVVVLGMHRSYTSAITRLLNLAGAGIAPDLVDATPTNPAGHWESAKLVRITERILRKLGRSWHDWRPLPPGAAGIAEDADLMSAIRDDLAETLRTAEVSVVKDPRLGQLFAIWRAAVAPLDADIRVVIPVRAPLEVAASLHERDRLARPRGLLLWLRQVLAAEEASRDLPRRIVDARRLLEGWQTELPALIRALDLPLARLAPETIEQFIDRDLFHHRDLAAAHVPDWVAECHDLMLALARDDEPDKRSRLDALRAQFDGHCENFDTYVPADFLEPAQLRSYEAIQALGTSIHWPGLSPSTLRAAAEAAAMQKDWKLASDALRELDTSGSATASDLRLFGWALVTLRRWDEAAEVADRVVAGEPDAPGSMFLRATVLERSGDKPAALAAARALLARHPNFSPAQDMLDRLSR